MSKICVRKTRDVNKIKCIKDGADQLLMKDEWSQQTNATAAASRATNIIIPDCTPKAVNQSFYTIYNLLLPILAKDSVPRFLRFLKEDGRGICWDGAITAETLNHIVIQEATRCAKLVFDGQAPELNGHRANPNCMNQYGYFPLHEAAEGFSVDMIKLLLNYGALPNVRTDGAYVIKNLLPIHVAVENTCLHKYLEDNLFPNVDHPDYPTKVDDNYIYKLIHLLCLPEMKMFLDTTRLLAENTDNLLDEIWNYVKDGKVVQTAVLLLSAQKLIRGGSLCKRNGVTELDGFSAIINRIRHSMTLEVEMCRNEEMHMKIKVMLSTLLLVNIISQTGEVIDAYIQRHSEVPHAEVLDRVSSILKSYGFFPIGEGVNVENIRPYKFSMPSGGSLAGTKLTPHVAGRPIAIKLVGRKRMPRGWKDRSIWLSVFPYWRSVLASRFPVKVYPAHALDDSKHDQDIVKVLRSESKSTHEVPSSIPDRNIGLLERIPQQRGIYQPKRGFGTAAWTILGPIVRSRSISMGKVPSPIPVRRHGILGSIPQQPGSYQPKRVFGTAALMLLKMFRNA